MCRPFLVFGQRPPGSMRAVAFDAGPLRQVLKVNDEHEKGRLMTEEVLPDVSG